MSLSPRSPRDKNLVARGQQHDAGTDNKTAYLTSTAECLHCAWHCAGAGDTEISKDR